MRMSYLDTLSVILLVAGAINWGLVGLFDFNLVEAIFGAGTVLTRVVYLLVGVAGLTELWTWATRMQLGERAYHAMR